MDSLEIQIEYGQIRWDYIREVIKVGQVRGSEFAFNVVGWSTRFGNQQWCDGPSCFTPNVRNIFHCNGYGRGGSPFIIETILFEVHPDDVTASWPGDGASQCNNFGGPGSRQSIDVTGSRPGVGTQMDLGWRSLWNHPYQSWYDVIVATASTPSQIQCYTSPWYAVWQRNTWFQYEIGPIYKGEQQRWQEQIQGQSGMGHWSYDQGREAATLHALPI